MVTDYRQAANVVSEEQQTFGVFKDRVSLETALDQLRQTGFPLHQISILVKESDPQGQSSPLANGDSRNYGTLTSGGHPLEGAMSALTGLNRITLPEFGLVLVIGPEAEPLIQAVQSQVVLSAAEVLQQLGLPEAAAQQYRTPLMMGAYLIVLRGAPEEMRQAAAVLNQYGLQQ
ncbi:MAG: hypothetical protein ICV62_12950 [Cyanobacteria bacterium Co-bin13]|nr:hypothetical protein [Cyanobacteria bacterium Co-bin13]